MSNLDNQSWTAAADALFAKSEEEIKSKNSVTRLSGECRKAVTKAWMKECLSAIKHLEACLRLKTHVS